jgi:heme a synthase
VITTATGPDTASSERQIRRLAVASLVSQITICLTGAIVRLTNSGLGCPEWPRCTAASVTTTPAMGAHGVIEFGNRLLTFVLAAIALATFVTIARTLRTAHPRRDLLTPATILLAGIPIQAVIGGITVWTGLNPWVVMLHFNLSAMLVGTATVLVRRSQRPRGQRPARVTDPLPNRLGIATLATACTVVYLGTIVTGTGPHAGDPSSPRTGFDLANVSRIHGTTAIALVAFTAALYLVARTLGLRHLANATAVLLVVEIVQGAVGLTQYLLELPELLVGVHVLGAALLTAAAVNTFLAARWDQPAPDLLRASPTATRERAHR